MARKDPRIDAYIAEAEPFARPILKRLRKIVHAGCPKVEETVKWSMPHFDYKGMFIGMAAFKRHCSFGFWREAELALGRDAMTSEGMGHFGRITSLDDLPDEKTLLGYVRKAVAIKDAGVKKSAPSKRRGKAIPQKEPSYLANALRRNVQARKNWDAFSTSQRNEYIEWLLGAKREETREKRLEKTLSQLADGRSLNWKYQVSA